MHYTHVILIALQERAILPAGLAAHRRQERLQEPKGLSSCPPQIERKGKANSRYFLGTEDICEYESFLLHPHLGSTGAGHRPLARLEILAPFQAAFPRECLWQEDVPCCYAMHCGSTSTVTLTCGVEGAARAESATYAQLEAITVNLTDFPEAQFFTLSVCLPLWNSFFSCVHSEQPRRALR